MSRLYVSQCSTSQKEIRVVEDINQERSGSEQDIAAEKIGTMQLHSHQLKRSEGG